MKTYTYILIVVAVLAVVVLGGYAFRKNSNTVVLKEEKKEFVNMKTFEGQVTRIFEGENKIVYSFDISENGTTSISMDGALIKVTDPAGLYASLYMSYEGGRGLTPAQYINQVISPHVAVISMKGTSTIGLFDWQIAESPASEWHVTSVLNGQWLIIVENKKSLHDDVQETLKSLRAN